MTIATPTKEVPPGQEAIAQAIAQRFGVPVPEVLAWHTAGYGWGEIAIAYSLAKESGRPVAQIFQMKETLGGWGKVTQALGLDPGNSDRSLGNIKRETPAAIPTAGPGQQDQGQGRGRGLGRN